MCGIAGIIAYHERALPLDADELLDIRDAMAARGPDGAGLWIDGSRRIGLAHRRLAIIDLSDAAAQPMASQDGSLVVTFNGEIYNYRELKAELERSGYPFRSNSDTEVLLALYREHGEAMVHRLRGMYAFAIWDAPRQRLFLARDPFGIKPLYYCDDGRSLRFASQVKALAAGNGVRLTPDPAGHAGFFVFGYVPEPHTLHREIRAVPAGSHLTIVRGAKPKVETYYDVSARIAAAAPAAPGLAEEERVEIVSGALQDSVAHHLVADVPVGVFLSAGVDSNVIAANARTASRAELATITLGFNEFRGLNLDEVPLAEAQARHIGARHTTRYVDRAEFYDSLQKIWAAMDQPSTDGVNSWLVAKAAAERGLKVCLSGLGGDELFGGYPSFHQVPRAARALATMQVPRVAKSAYRRLMRTLPERWVSPKLAGILDYGGSLAGAYLLRRSLFLPSELGAFLEPAFLNQGLSELDANGWLGRLQRGIGDPYGSVAALELCTYMRGQLLRDIDWASMSHGLEVRVPFVDVRFFETLLPLLRSPNPPTKGELVKSAGDRLLPEIRSRKKTGFATPVQKWLLERYSGTMRQRGLRSWSRIVYSNFVPELSLVPADPIPPRLAKQRLIVVYRIGQLGDTLVSLPAIQAIRMQYPQEQIVLLTDHHPGRVGLVSAWDVIGPTGLLNGVMHYPVTSGLWRNLLMFLRLARRIRAIDPAQIINLAPRTRKQDARRDRLFFQHLCSVADYCALEPMPRTSSVASGTSPNAEPEWLRLLRTIEPTAHEWNYSLPLPRWGELEASSALAELPDGVSEIVAVGPGSKMSAKRWPEERFAEVGRYLLAKRERTALAVLGGREDQELGARLCAVWGARSVNLAGRLSIPGSAAVLARCSAYVGNDTGTMHLAAVVGTPCAAIFSARDVPGKWDPVGSNHRVLRHETSCAGCMLEECIVEAKRCLTSISVSDVCAAARDLLEFDGEATISSVSSSRGRLENRPVARQS